MDPSSLYGGLPFHTFYKISLTNDVSQESRSNSINLTLDVPDDATTPMNFSTINSTELSYIGWKLIVLEKTSALPVSGGGNTHPLTCFKGHVCLGTDKNSLLCFDLNSHLKTPPRALDLPDNILGLCSTEVQMFFCSAEGALWVISDIATTSIDRVPVSDRKVRQISCGKEHSLILTTLGQVYTLGGGSRGQLGHGDLESTKEPRPVDALSGVFTVRVEAGGWHSLVLSDIGDVYSWGWNESGQVGLPCMKDEKGINRCGPHDGRSLIVFPSLLFEDDEDINITDISCGSRHSAAVADGGRLYTWGWNFYGQLLQDQQVNIQDRPKPIDSPGRSFTSVRCGGWSTVAWFVQSS